MIRLRPESSTDPILTSPPANGSKTLFQTLKCTESPFCTCFDVLNPKVQRDGNMALLTFNLLSFVKQPDGTEKVVARWNSTEVYRKIGKDWKIIHSHWSYIKPASSQGKELVQ